MHTHKKKKESRHNTKDSRQITREESKGSSMEQKRPTKTLPLRSIHSRRQRNEKINYTVYQMVIRAIEMMRQGKGTWGKTCNFKQDAQGKPH